jgi:aspartate/methionine/tyrosine aminotransferase
MDVLAKANALDAAGRNIAHLEVGQPMSPAPMLARAAVADAVARGEQLGYTAACGTPALRQAIVDMYRRVYKVDVPIEAVHVTVGSSAGFTLSFLAAFDVGDAVALPSCSYPCYRNILSALGVTPVPLPIDTEFKITGATLRAAVRERAAAGLPPLRGLILSSPANPTGVMLSPGEIADLCAACDELGVTFVSDEIYHGIEYPAHGAPRAATALEYSPSRAIVINSFSKYYSMTGWRVGWLVAPAHLRDAVNKLNQNLFISAPAASQLAASMAVTAEAGPELDAHVRRYEHNRGIVVESLRRLGLTAPHVAPAHGAFYIYVDLSPLGVTDSAALCVDLLEHAGVAVTPGIDFEFHAEDGAKRVRFCYAGDTAEVERGMALVEKRFVELFGKHARRPEGASSCRRSTAKPHRQDQGQRDNHWTSGR